MERLFCPSCGNKTLMKVAVTIADDGTVQYHYPKRKRNFNIRGTKVPLLLDMLLLFYILLSLQIFLSFICQIRSCFSQKQFKGQLQYKVRQSSRNFQLTLKQLQTELKCWVSYQLISCHWSLADPLPENVRKPEIFSGFQGINDPKEKMM